MFGEAQQDIECGIQNVCIRITGWINGRQYHALPADQCLHQWGPPRVSAVAIVIAGESALLP